MMKFNQLLVGAMVSLLTMASCGKEASDAPVLASEVKTDQVESKMRQVRIKLDAGSNEGLRVVYGTHADGSGKLTGLQLEEGKNLIIRVAVRGGGSTNVVAQDIAFTKVPGENRGVYDGVISIPEAVPGSNAGYQIAAVFLRQEGGVSNHTSSAADFSTGPVVLDPTQRSHALTIGHLSDTRVLTQAGGKTQDIAVPYISKWQPIGVDAAAKATYRAVLDLNPIGTLLRMRIRNESETSLNVHSIKVVSSSYTPRIGVHFTGDSGTDEVFWISDNFYSTVDYALAEPVTLAPKQTSAWVYTWVMPRATTHELMTSATIGMTADPATRVYSPVAFRTNKPLPFGSVPMTLVYGGPHTANLGDFSDNDLEWGTETTPAIPKMAIEYLADYALDAAGTGFVSDYDTSNTNVGWFNHTDALARFSGPITIAGQRYSMPTLNEMKSIFPYMFDESGIGLGLIVKGKTTHDLIERDVKIGSVTKTYKSDFHTSQDGRAIYAIRFKDDKNYNKTAFRYRLETIGASAVYRVECIYLGADSYDKIEDVAKDAFWTANSAKIKVATLPLYGSRLVGNGIEQPITSVNRLAYYLLNAPKVDKTSIHFMAFEPASGIYSGRIFISIGSSERTFPILLFKR